MITRCHVGACGTGAPARFISVCFGRALVLAAFSARVCVCDRICVCCCSQTWLQVCVPRPALARACVRVGGVCRPEVSPVGVPLLGVPRPCGAIITITITITITR